MQRTLELHSCHSPNRKKNREPAHIKEVYKLLNNASSENIKNLASCFTAWTESRWYWPLFKQPFPCVRPLSTASFNNHIVLGEASDRTLSFHSASDSTLRCFVPGVAHPSHAFIKPVCANVVTTLDL